MRKSVTHDGESFTSKELLEFPNLYGQKSISMDEFIDMGLLNRDSILNAVTQRVRILTAWLVG